jgi:hypothetical protein
MSPVSARTSGIRKLAKEIKEDQERFEDQLELSLSELSTKPKVWGDCSRHVPCPWVGCKYHLYIDVDERTGSIKYNFPHLEPWEIPATCSLAVAKAGGVTLDTIGEYMNLSRERVRQLEVSGAKEMEKSLPEDLVEILLHRSSSQK